MHKNVHREIIQITWNKIVTPPKKNFSFSCILLLFVSLASWQTVWWSHVQHTETLQVLQYLHSTIQGEAENIKLFSVMLEMHQEVSYCVAEWKWFILNEKMNHWSMESWQLIKYLQLGLISPCKRDLKKRQGELRWFRLLMTWTSDTHSVKLLIWNMVFQLQGSVMKKRKDVKW